MQLLRIYAGLILAAVSFSSPAGAQSEPMPKASIAVLDYQRIISGSVAAQGVRNTIETYRKKYREQFSIEERRIRKKTEQLRAQRKILSSTAFADKRAEYEREIKDLQKRIQAKKSALDNAFKKSIADIQKALVPIVRDITTRKGYNLVVDSSNVLFAAKTMDITTQVLAQLNKKLPAIAIQKIED